MATKNIAWGQGSGSINIEYTGQGNGTIVITSDPNNLGVERTKQIEVNTTDGSVSRRITIVQEANYRIQYLTFIALESGTFSFEIPADITSSHIPGGVSYSIDNGATWVNTEITSAVQTITTPTIDRGNKVMWKATANRFGISSSIYCKFTSTGYYEVSGNIMSLEYGDDFADKTSLKNYTYAFYGLFRSNSKLISAENLVLPATTLRQNCYQALFSFCTSMQKAPKRLPATTLTNSCYRTMFYGCSNLTSIPILHATTLVTNCYYTMFVNCLNLKKITCLATNISASNCTYQWVSGVAEIGIFTKASSMGSWPTGISGTPDGWTVKDNQ